MDNYSQPMQLRTIQTVKKSDANETRICENISDSARGRFTVLVVNDHKIMHRFIEIYDNAIYLQERPEITMYTEDGKFFIVYPYTSERPLMDFYMGETMSLRECEEICVNLILACMTSNLPWPVLYLMLRQRELHLSKDHSVHLSYRLDLSDLSEEIGEAECVVECAKLLLELPAEGLQVTEMFTDGERLYCFFSDGRSGGKRRLTAYELDDFSKATEIFAA